MDSNSEKPKGVDKFKVSAKNLNKTTRQVIQYGVLFIILFFALTFLILYGLKNQELVAERKKNSIPINRSKAIPYTKEGRNCQEIKLKFPNAPSGIYEIHPWKYQRHKTIRVYCDMDTDNQQWIVIQRRLNGLVNFQKYWNEYKVGFGQLDKEFWLGNDNIHLLTTARRMKLRVDMWNEHNSHAYAEYSSFSISNEAGKYRLKISGYSGNASDCMASYHSLNNRYFTTRDRDNDGRSGGSCSQSYGYGGWWSYNCFYANLNGAYYNPGTISEAGIVWYYWRGSWNSLKQTEMKLKYIK